MDVFEGIESVRATMILKVGASSGKNPLILESTEKAFQAFEVETFLQVLWPELTSKRACLVHRSIGRRLGLRCNR